MRLDYMEQQALELTVRDVMAGLFGMAPEEIGETSSIDTVEHWDSLQHVNLIMSLEQEFGITFDMDDALEMTAFPLVCEQLRKYLAAQG